MTISAQVIADSISPENVRLTTLELEYPRFIHSEFMTHRVFSRNAASSRAIPVQRIIELLKTGHIAEPVEWGKNQSGMQAKELLDTETAAHALGKWLSACDDAIEHAEDLFNLGVHKQLVNRILEPWQHMKVVVTATEWDNFFWLRDHDDAQPEIRELAKQMRQAMNTSEPTLLDVHEWHMPYVSRDDKENYTTDQCLALSVSCCAQVSYRKLDPSMDKAMKIRHMLTSSDRIHASPFEHQAKVADVWNEHLGKIPGITHENIDGSGWWSGNFRGWIQHRQLIKE